MHLVVQRHANLAEQIIGHFKARATQQLIEEGIHPFQDHRQRDGTIPRAWASRGWKVYLDCVQDILRASQYVEENPLKQGMPRQGHPFVTDYAARFDAIEPEGLSVE